MMRFLLSLIVFFTLGCQNRTIGPQAQQAVSRNAQDLSLLAKFLDIKLPWVSIILAEKAQTIAEAVPLADGVAKPAPVLTPQVLALADRSPEAAAMLASQVQRQEAATRTDVKTEQEQSWNLSGLFSWTGVGTLAGLLLFGLRAASAMGVPYVGALEGMLTGLFSLRQKKLDAANTLVEGAEVARHGLVAVEQVLPAETQQTLAAKITEVTGGRANNLGDLFKMLSKAYAIDQGKVTEADAYLSQLRSQMDTEAGRPPMLTKALRGI